MPHAANFETDLQFSPCISNVKENHTHVATNKLIKKGYREEIIFQGEESEQKMYWKPYDYLWIGRKKK